MKQIQNSAYLSAILVHRPSSSLQVKKISEKVIFFFLGDISLGQILGSLKSNGFTQPK